MLALLTLLAAREFWRGRAEPLMSRWPTIIVLWAHAVILLVRVPALLLSSSFRGDIVLSTFSFTLFAFATLLFTVVLAFLQLNMTKERTELKHKINSLVDPLSGVANRRAFLDDAAALLVRHETDHEPLAMLLFDLDHFKQINDQFGHAIGDTVLQTFAGTASQTLGADVLFARIGGEEFASCLPVGDLDEAYAIADRVRRNFAAVAARFGNDALSPSVSVGSDAGERSARQRDGTAFDRRSGAVSGERARPQSRRAGGIRRGRSERRRAVNRAHHRPGPLGRRAAVGRPALACCVVRLSVSAGFFFSGE